MGALRNAELVPKYFPGARAVFYANTYTTPSSLLYKLRNNPNVELMLFNIEKIRDRWLWPAPLITFNVYPAWRFFAAEDLAHWDYMMFRDAQSRITDREQAAVQEWLLSNNDFHVMRDHPSHNGSILSSMWGMKRRGYDALKFNMTGFVEEYVRANPYTLTNDFDQTILRSRIWPMIRATTRVHDSYTCGTQELRGKCTTGFATVRSDDGNFVGNQYNAADERVNKESATAVPEACRRVLEWTYG